eukprot:CAMPEP_0177602488 /NCGR_PEP_ID=MMETSP0419_2-20121207/14895_1 /TAXON_ID=582737 /ORGANISM="Tetraselmis sp., Strain GSL018" /LENGTH=397 /DNA_ID=CAMNT_0019095975 /DNA_START=672 /DNA_END=1863 /DNA_ORIENTATION=-
MDQLGKAATPFSSLVSFVSIPSSDPLEQAQIDAPQQGWDSRCTRKASSENVKLLMRHKNDFNGRGQGSFLRLFLKEYAQNSRTAVIVDVGANTGAFSLAAVKLASQHDDLNCYVFAYEPVASTYEKLVEAVSASKGKIRPLNLGVGRRSGSLPIRYTGLGDQHATFLSSAGKQQNGTNSSLVHVVALDDEVRPSGSLGQLGGLVTLVKISAEGFNYRSLQGMRTLLQQHSIKVIMWEYDSNESTERRVTTEVNFISSHGYAVFLLGSRKGRPLEYYQGDAAAEDDDTIRLLRVDGAFSSKQLDTVRNKANIQLNLVAVVQNHSFLRSADLLHALPSGWTGASADRRPPQGAPASRELLGQRLCHSPRTAQPSPAQPPAWLPPPPLSSLAGPFGPHDP